MKDLSERLEESEEDEDGWNSQEDEEDSDGSGGVEQEESKEGRGFSLVESKLDRQNIMLIYGARPGMGVNIDTKLIHDVMTCFLELYNKRNLTVILPDILD